MSVEEDKQFQEIKRLNKDVGDGDTGDVKHRRRKSVTEDDIIVNVKGKLVVGKDKPTQTPLTNSLPRHIKSLQQKLKLRYHRTDNDFISYFDDVEFDQRPSILDGSISEPFQLKFSGPTLEKDIKQKEKLRRKKLRAAAKNGDLAQDLTQSQTLEINDFANFHTSFAGLYVALWMSIAFGILRILFNFYWTHNNSLTDLPIIKFMTTDLFVVAFLDLIFYLATYVSFFVQWLCKKHIIPWHPVGRPIMIVFEFAFFLCGILIPEHVLGLHWIAKIFLFLHSLVLLMKTHSYTFYHGYLWDLWKELHYSRTKLNDLKDKNGVDPETIEILKKSVDFCDFEFNLQSQQCQDKQIKFPDTITFKNYFMYTMFPVLVYQNRYPRTEKIRWNYVVEKIFAIFGTIFIMIVNAQVFMYPIAIHAISIRDSPWISWSDRLTEWAKIMIDIAPSFICMYLLTFYLIWDAILNCIAELTRFGDRYFYGDWWNCVNWGEFSRIWNIPVHKFLLRHVYHSSISAFQLSRGQATFMTFFLSAIFHELSMYVIFNRLRFYLFFFQMLQLPLVSLSNSKLLRDKPIIGNVIFWIGICIGPSVMCSLYLTI
ncbi:sterol O-acyltransferase 2 [Monosporozyma unispora]